MGGDKAPDVSHEILSTANAIEVWFDRRLSFEPKGDALAARNGLREVLRRWRPQPGRLLHATYTSLDLSFCDVENVLFYNVGPACFAHLVVHGLGFARRHAAPPPSPKGRTFEHHHRYAFIDEPAAGDFHPRHTFRFSLARLSSTTKPHEVWWAATAAEPVVGPRLRSPFELHIMIETPKPFTNLASVIKPLLDGVISSLHAESCLDEEAVRRLATKSGVDLEAITARLLNPPNPLLGPRDLVGCFQRFVKWNPADELCERCTIVVRPAERASSHTLIVAIR